jgi:hypothetical protein
MRAQSKRLSRDRGVWEPLRSLKRHLVARANHPIYAARGNEQPLLQDLIDDDPPEGGLAAYVADLEGKEG